MIEQIKKSGVIEEFVVENNFSWGYSEWIKLLDHLRALGFDNFNPDDVGALLEQERRRLVPGDV